MATIAITTGVDFGPGYINLLSNIGYTVYTFGGLGSPGTPLIPRTTSGIAIAGSLVAATFSGQTGVIYFVAWDTGGSSPITQWQIVPGQIFQSSDIASIAGIVLTGSIAALPPPSSTIFTVILDSTISTSTVVNDIVGLYVTFRSGAREPSFQQITNCTITVGPPSTLALTTNAFAGAPSTGDLVIISG